MSGSISSEPVTDRRAISQSFCSASYGGLRARRNGGERVRRRITVIESDPDMNNMPDDAVRALHESLHPNDYDIPDQYLSMGLGDPRAYAPEAPIQDPGVAHIGIPVPPEEGHGENLHASTDRSVANGNELHRIVHAPEGVLPSDLVSCPAVRSQSGMCYATMGVVMLALLVADIIACIRVVLGTLCTICGKGPRKCQKACRLIVNQRMRTTCGKACCLPEDHGAVWNHTCPEHA